MSESYVIGITLALEDEISPGLATMREQLAQANLAIEQTKLRRASLRSEMADAVAGRLPERQDESAVTRGMTPREAWLDHSVAPAGRVMEIAAAPERSALPAVVSPSLELPVERLLEFAPQAGLPKLPVVEQYPLRAAVQYSASAARGAAAAEGATGAPFEAREPALGPFEPSMEGAMSRLWPLPLELPLSGGAAAKHPSGAHHRVSFDIGRSAEAPRGSGPGLVAHDRAEQIAREPWMGPLAPAAASAVPSHDASGRMQVSGDVFLDGQRVGRWMGEQLEREAGRAPVSGSQFDRRQSLSLPSGGVGF